jgi:anti-anti-sigma factor
MAFGCDPVLTSNGVAGPAGPMQLSWQVSASGHAEVALRGELDLATADRVVSYVSEIIDRHDGPVVADLGDITFCDACGLGALVRIVSYAERTGRPLELARPSRPVSKIMRITGVDHRLLAVSRA